MVGAVVPVIIGRIGNSLGLRTGVAFLYTSFGSVRFVEVFVENGVFNVRKLW